MFAILIVFNFETSIYVGELNFILTFILSIPQELIREHERSIGFHYNAKPQSITVLPTRCFLRFSFKLKFKCHRHFKFKRKSLSKNSNYQLFWKFLLTVCRFSVLCSLMSSCLPL